MLKPPTRQKNAYERVPLYDEWINGEIIEIQHNPEHKSVWKGKEKIREAVRFRFTLDGCQYPRLSKWMTFNYGSKAPLYNLFLSTLVEGAAPDMDFDLDTLKGMKVKTMWQQNGEFDNLIMVKPLNGKINPKEIPF